MGHEVDEMGQDRPVAPVERRIISAWTDYNGHLNVTWIAHLFDLGTDNLLDALQIGETYAARTGCSTFALGAHVSYLSEASLGDDVEVHSTLIGVDAKRIKYRHELTAADAGRVIAVLEQVSMHVDLKARRSAPWPSDVKATLKASLGTATPSHLCDGLQLKPEPRHD
tara:strand:- start:9136 stop:9639 length:504 start_codon:yes stop_codon:yes gene_type:complete